MRHLHGNEIDLNVQVGVSSQTFYRYGGQWR
jgi:hypothetical protein